jgi:tetratricopeptide (TPR) repeat protein
VAKHEEAEDAEAASPAMTDSAGASAAVAVALGRRSKTQAKDDPDVTAFLKEQAHLARLQAEHLNEQRDLILSRLRWGRFSDRVKALLQVLTVAVGLGVVVLIGSMAWDAHEDHGLVVEAFSVPPDLAHNGLTGQVAASRFLDKLQALQTATEESDRPSQSYHGNWGSDIKVEIPETGLTFGEFDKLLRERLGHVSHVTGEVVGAPGGAVSLTARLGDAPPQTFTGPASDFDALAQKAAEAVYGANQPYRYAEYLDNKRRLDEAFKVISDLAASGPRSEQGWAYAKWALMDLNDRGDADAAIRHGTLGLGYSRGSDLNAEIALVNSAVWTGDEESDLRLSKLIAERAQHRAPDTSEIFFQENRLVSLAWLQFVTPDYPASVNAWDRMLSEGYNVHYGKLAPQMMATATALNHDPARARAIMAKTAGKDERLFLWDIAIGAFLSLPNYWIPAEEGNWSSALATARGMDTALEAGKAERPIYSLMQKSWIWPLEALAQARSGDIPGAEALIGKTALDCYLCLRVRGQIAAEKKDWPEAERWFAAAARRAPSLPYAYAEWARMRFDHGDASGAIALARIAHDKAPRFADPLETWGEALFARRDYDGAVERLQQAGAIAPQWTRNRSALAAARRAKG